MFNRYTHTQVGTSDKADASVYDTLHTVSSRSIGEVDVLPDGQRVRRVVVDTVCDNDDDDDGRG